MHSELTQARLATLIFHGALLFAGGLLAGVGLAVALLGHFEIWPLIGKIDFEIPGESRAWLRSHIGFLMNGMGIWLFALLATKLRFSEAQQKLYVICVLVTGWFNGAGYLTGTIFGVHGLSFGGDLANTLTYLFFLTAIVTVIIQVALVLVGARRLKQES